MCWFGLRLDSSMHVIACETMPWHSNAQVSALRSKSVALLSVEARRRKFKPRSSVELSTISNPAEEEGASLLRMSQASGLTVLSDS